VFTQALYNTQIATSLTPYTQRAVAEVIGGAWSFNAFTTFAGSISVVTQVTIGSAGAAGEKILRLANSGFTAGFDFTLASAGNLAGFYNRGLSLFTLYFDMATNATTVAGAAQFNTTLNATGAITQNAVPVVLNTRAINTTNSLQGGGNLTADRTLSLVGDALAPGATWYYGTDATGAKGFFPLSGVVGVPEAPVDGNVYGRQNASWANLGGAGLYVLKVGDTMTGPLINTTSGVGIRLESANPILGLINTGGAVDTKSWLFTANPTNLSFTVVNDAFGGSKSWLSVARVGVAVSGITLGNSTDLALNTIWGSVSAQTTAAPAFATTPQRSISVQSSTGAAVVGVYGGDGVNNPRADLFANGTTAAVGLNWSYSAGLTRFQFQRVGVEIFSYTTGGVTVWNGSYFVENTGGASLGLQYNRAGVRRHLQYMSDDGSNNDWGHNVFNGSGNFISTPFLVSGLTGKLSLTSGAGSVDMDISAAALVLRTAARLRINNSANSGFRGIQLTTADELGYETRGGLWHWSATDLPRGQITISTTTPAVTGSAGDIVLVYE
jgi:hypothetical protein